MPISLSVIALGLVVWFMVSTTPGQSMDDVANINVRVDAPANSVLKVNMSVDAILTNEGGATAAVEVSFVCEGAADLVVTMTSQEARGLTYTPDSPGPRLSNSLLVDPRVQSVEDGLQVSGSCTKIQPVNVPLTITFPRGSVGVRLERGKYAFGLDLFAHNTADTFSVNSYSIGVRTPKGGLLSEAFDSKGRTFNRATWAAESNFSLPVYGIYTVPDEVARAHWSDNAILLVLGSLVGIGLDAGLRLARRDHHKGPPTD